MEVAYSYCPSIIKIKAIDMPGMKVMLPTMTPVKSKNQTDLGACIGGKNVRPYAIKSAIKKQIIWVGSHFLMSSRIARGNAINIKLKKNDPIKIGLYFKTYVIPRDIDIRPVRIPAASVKRISPFIYCQKSENLNFARSFIECRSM